MHAILMKLLQWVFAGLIVRLLVGAGLTLFGYGAFVSLLNFALEQVNQALGGMAADALNVLLLGGLGDILSIIGSAMLTRVSLLAGIAGLARVQDIQQGN